MKKWVWIFMVTGAFCCTLFPAGQVQAQTGIAEIIKAAVKKVIKAVDLQIQRLQNKTIWLQNAQKELENTLSKLKLTEISDWVEKQRKLYADYYEELWEVKNAVTLYRSVKDIIRKQAQLVDEYKRAYSLFKNDSHFTVDELHYIADVYAGILDESVKNIDQLLLVVNSFATQMSDAKRIEIINRVADHVDQNVVDLKRFNNSNVLLSLQRAKNQSEIDIIKSYYGLTK